LATDPAKPHRRRESHILKAMTATARFSRVAVAVALGVTAPLVLRAEAAQAAPIELATAGARLASPESASVAPARHARPVADTSARRERGKSERTPAAPAKRRAPKAKSGGVVSPPPQSSGQAVPDQPWETEFFVQNTVPTRHFVVRLASATGN